MSDNDQSGFGGLDQGEYDALAELFLGDSTFAPPRRAQGRSETTLKDAQTRPTSEITRTEESATEPVETRPSETIRRAVTSSSRELPRTRPPSLGPATVELVILGHLPVRAGLWLKEYAASVAAESTGPVALLRLAPDIASVDLIGSASTEPHGPAPTFADAVRRARIDATRFVLRVNETAEPALAENKAVDRVTILTGADEAALVASYRLVKSLAAAWDRQFEMDEGPTLRLAIMGSSDENSRAAAKKLQSAAESFLQRRVEILICSSKIGATGSASVFRGEANESVGELLQLIRPSRAKSETVEPTKSEPGLRLVGATEASSAGVKEEKPMSVADEPTPEIVIRRRAVGTKSETRTETPAATPTMPQVAAEPRMRVASKGSLASRLEGLTVLESVCPMTSGVEFAAAADGSLHLITESRGGTGSGVGLERLLTASAWARAHFSLLLRAEPLLAMPSPERSDDDGPVLHLLTDDARATRGLLDSDVFVHLCREVSVGGESVWVVDRLN